MYDQEDFEGFNPWPFLKRLGGILLIIVGVAWLNRYFSPLNQFAKLSVVLAGGLRSQAVRNVLRGSYLSIPLWRTRRYWLFTAGSLVLTGFGVGTMELLEPLSLGLRIHYLTGMVALFLGGYLITVKILTRSELLSSLQTKSDSRS